LGDWKDGMGFSTNGSSNVRNSDLTPEVPSAGDCRLQSTGIMVDCRKQKELYGFLKENAYADADAGRIF